MASCAQPPDNHPNHFCEVYAPPAPQQVEEEERCKACHGVGMRYTWIDHPYINDKRGFVRCAACNGTGKPAPIQPHEEVERMGRWREFDRNDALNRVARVILEVSGERGLDYAALSVRYDIAARTLDALAPSIKEVPEEAE